jgi:uncharacterized membrane protein
MSEVVGLSLIFAAAGALFIGLGVPLLRGKVPPNQLYGCRTERTLADPALWREANRSSGKDFTITGILVLAASLAALAFGRNADPNQVVFTLLSVMLLCVGASSWRCFRAGRKS